MQLSNKESGGGVFEIWSTLSTANCTGLQKKKKEKRKKGKEGNIVVIAGLLTFLVISIYLERVEQ